jgi:hypothetical protein
MLLCRVCSIYDNYGKRGASMVGVYDAPPLLKRLTDR